MEGQGATYKQDAGDALQKCASSCACRSDMVVQKVLLQGDPATELLAFAASVNARSDRDGQPWPRVRRAYAHRQRDDAHRPLLDV